MFPREKFDLDTALQVTTTATACALPLTSINTIRVIVLGAAGIDDAGTNKITVTVGGQAIVFKAADLDKNGVGIAHVRGTLCDANNNISYTLGGTGTVTGVFLDAVDNVG
jgi:hypothetical protein